MESFLFFFFAIVAIAGAVLMITHRNPIYCALFLIVTLFSLAGLYVLLNAPFIAAVHIIVYAGAIMVLFLFVIMLLDIKADARREGSRNVWQAVGALAAVVLFLEIGLFVSQGQSAFAPTPGGMVGSTEAIGKLLFTKYLLAFEVASVLLLSAIIGSVILAKRRLN